MKGILDAKLKPKEDQTNEEGEHGEKEEIIENDENEESDENDENDNAGDDNDLEGRLNSNISSIPGLYVSPKERRQTIDKMKKAGKPGKSPE